MARLDMDAFFAYAEILCYPKLRGKLVVIGDVTKPPALLEEEGGRFFEAGVQF